MTIYVYLSQSIIDKSIEELIEERHRMIDFLNYDKDSPISRNNKIAIVNNIYPKVFDDMNQVWILGKCIQYISEADIVIFPKSTSDDKRCMTEKDICKIYKIPYIHYLNDGYITNTKYNEMKCIYEIIEDH